jgi:hypothetical protein
LIFCGSTPRTLICVCGLTSGVFGAGEIVRSSSEVAASASVTPNAANPQRTKRPITSVAREHPPNARPACELAINLCKAIPGMVS